LTLLPVRSQACAEYVMAPIDRDGVRLVDWIDSLTPRKKYCTREADRCKRDLHFTHVLVLGSELRRYGVTSSRRLFEIFHDFTSSRRNTLTLVSRNNWQRKQFNQALAPKHKRSIDRQQAYNHVDAIRPKLHVHLQ
jgi:hypothetical protein